MRETVQHQELTNTENGHMVLDIQQGKQIHQVTWPLEFYHLDMILYLHRPIQQGVQQNKTKKQIPIQRGVCSKIKQQNRALILKITCVWIMILHYQSQKRICP